MFIYFFVFGMFFIAAFYHIHLANVGGAAKKLFWPIYFVPFVTLVFFYGYRYDVGADYWSYLAIFDQVSAGDEFANNRFEPGFLAVVCLMSKLGLTGNDFLFVVYSFTFLLLFLSVKNVDFKSATMIGLSLLLLLGVGPTFSATNLVRQSLAVSISVYFCVLLYENRLLATSLSAIVGSLFHYSSPIVLIFSIVPRGVIRCRYWLLSVLAVVLFSRYFFDLIFDFLSSNSETLGKFSTYFENDAALNSSTGLGVRLFFEVFLFLFLSFYAHKIDRRAVWFFNIAFLGVLLAFIFKDYAMFLRGAAFFTVFKYLAIPWFLPVFKGFSRYFFVAFVVLFSILTFSRSAFSDQFSPYFNVIFN